MEKVDLVHKFFKKGRD